MPTIEIDEDRRELRSGAQAVAPQPKVFELLVYLARHRERVVPKAELLDAIWPGVVVTEASLQRAISLARSTLAELGRERGDHHPRAPWLSLSSGRTTGCRGREPPARARAGA